MLPSTVVELLILFFAVFPGWIAYELYKSLFGSNWRLTDWEKIIRSIGFSLFGFAIYTLLAIQFNLPLPIYIISSTFTMTSIDPLTLWTIIISYLSHVVFSIIVMLLYSLILRLREKAIRQSSFPGAWDDFINNEVPNHWITITLQNKEAYAGYIKTADTSVSQTDRDIILGEPARYIKFENKYVAEPYKSLFIPASLISSIAVIHDEEVDQRITRVGSNIFEEG